ncbi:hypothetical protein MBLNU13_g05111t1 [Cladosporium sp. NU13]
MATNQVSTVPNTGFMDLPPEMRNQIYEPLISDTWDCPVITTEMLNCKSIFDLVLSLGLQKRFPLLATSKQVMHEALAFCLEKCTLRLENLDQLNAIRAVRHTSTFQQLRATIRSVALDISWYSHGINNPLEYHPRDLDQTKIKTLIPMSRLHLRCACCSQDFSKSTSFADLISELALLFPNIASLRIDFDKTTFSIHKKLRNDILAMPWPNLREVKFCRPDLERQLAKVTEQMLFFNRRSRHQAAMWPPQRVPWQLEMDFGYLEVLNEILEKDMLRKVKKGGSDARTPFSWGPD